MLGQTGLGNALHKCGSTLLQGISDPSGGRERVACDLYYKPGRGEETEQACLGDGSSLPNLAKWFAGAYLQGLSDLGILWPGNSLHGCTQHTAL